MAFTLARSKVVAVTLGPTGVGTVGLIDQVVTFVTQICALSLPAAAVKFLAAAHSESHETFDNWYQAFLQTLFAVSLLGTGIGIAAIWLWPALLGRELLTYGSLVILGLLSIAGTNVSALLANTMAAARRVQASAIYGFLLTASSATLAGVGVVLSGLRGYYVGSLIGLFSLVLGGIFFLHRREGLRIHGAHWDRLRDIRRYRNVLSFAAALYLVSFTTPLADLVARFAVLHMGGLPAAGLFQAAIGLALALRAVVRGSFSVFLMPTVNRRTDTKEKFEETVRFIQALSIVTGMIALPLVLFPELWLTLLYSRTFLSASPYIALFVVATIVQLFGAATQTLIAGLDYIGTYALVFAAGDVITGSLSWWLVPHLGFTGVGIALLCNGFLVFGLGAWKLWSKHRLKIHEALGISPLSALGAVAVGGATANILHLNSAEAFGARILIGGALAVLMLVSTRWRAN